MPTSNQQKKVFRSIGHHLKVIAMVAENGLSENVLSEIDQRLEDHELIKIKISINDRELRKSIITEISQSCGAELIQSIGKVAILYRPAKKPDPRLSNILRHQQSS